eukprot:2941206-Pyramimonas_sp.AAC.1
MQGFVWSHPRHGEVSVVQSGPRAVRKWLYHPLQSLLASRGLRHDEKAYLRSVAAGGQWPQHRQWLS